jgi:hypothetical protein
MGYKVYKYPLIGGDKDGYVTIMAPHDAKVVLVDHQEGVPTVWLEVATMVPPAHEERRSFRVYGTGHPISDYDIHRGSYTHGDFVWHVYENNP